MISRVVISCVFLTTSLGVIAQKNLVLQDRVYEPQIKTVMCYPNEEVDGNLLAPASARLALQNLLLEFDDLQEQKNNYYARLIHCNFDWSKSTLMDLDFMRDYNEVPVNDYSFSINTHIPYVHYRYQIPPVKLPGNYVVIVYRDGNRQDLILSKRIVIYDSRVEMAKVEDLSGLGNIRNTNQALNFKINYGGMDITNPLGTVHVTIRQNQRWDNAREDVKPNFVREDITELEYRFFDMDNTFQGGNEFRFVDFRSLNYPGQNTYKLDKSRKPYELSVALDVPRGSQPYSQYPDMNGNFTVDNQDYQQEPWISANYVYVTFGLKSPQLSNDVYVIGAFNQWAKTTENKMQYSQGTYLLRTPLKQGFYNYQYWVDGAEGSHNQIEGSYFQTENQYEVLVYFRPFQPNADFLIGYFPIAVNPR